jgi:thiamine-monophosphate kinase
MEPQTPVGEIGERALLRHLRSRIPSGPGVVVGVGDDAAAVETGPLTLITTDSLVEGIHFRREWSPPQLLGRKALSVNLSDVAAMAGVGRYATVSLGLPPDLTLSFVDAFYDGLLERAAETGVSIVGGNLTASAGHVVVDMTVLGQGDRLVRRAGAAPGDLVVVTGTLGAAAAGLRALEKGARLDADGGLSDRGRWAPEAAEGLVPCLRAQLDPSPPLAFGRALAEQEGMVHAAMDLSDGLSGDLLSLCEESDLSAWVEPDWLPVDPCAAALEKEAGGDAFSLALHGGEDYQILMAVPPERVHALREVASVWSVTLSVVGQFAPGPPGLSLRFGEAMRKLRPKSHDHFAARGRREPAPEA